MDIAAIKCKKGLINTIRKSNMSDRFYAYKAQGTFFNGTIFLSVCPEGKGRTSVGVLQSDWVQMWSSGPGRITRWTGGAHCCVPNLSHSSHTNTKLKTSKYVGVPKGEEAFKKASSPN